MGKRMQTGQMFRTLKSWSRNNGYRIAATLLTISAIFLYLCDEEISFLPQDALDFRSMPESKGSDKYPMAPYDINDKMPPAKVELEFIEYLRYISYMCGNMRRFGHETDGGWDVCIDDPFALKRPCLVYSFGIFKDWSFDDDLTVEYKCEDYAFDPSIGLKDHKRSPLIWFYNVGIGDLDMERGIHRQERTKHWIMKSISSIRHDLNHTKRVIDVIKMDIEYAEWFVLPDVIKTGDLKSVKQIVMEVHLKYAVKSYIYMFSILRTMEKLGFRKYKYHENAHCRRLSAISNITVSHCHELNFVNINYLNP